MVSEPEEWSAFASYLEDIKSLKESFFRAEIIYVPRTRNKKADSLARSARKETSFVVHMDQVPRCDSQGQYKSVKLLTKKKKDKKRS